MSADRSAASPFRRSWLSRLGCRLGMHSLEVERETMWFEYCFCVRCRKRGWRVIRV